MSTEENQLLVRRYVAEVLNGGKHEALDDFLSPNYKRYLSPTGAPVTSQVQKQGLAELRAAFPDIHHTIDDLVAEGDRVAIRLTIRGTHQGMFQGIPPTHKQMIVFAFDIFHIENGRFTEHWGGPDTLAMLQQLGVSVSTESENK